MTTLTIAQVLGSGASGVFRVAGALRPARLRTLAHLHGLRTVDADCGPAGDKRGLLRAIARALRFPDYFGYNWDALEDCLTDLDWLDARGTLLILSHADRLAGRAPRALAVALDTLEDAATYWAEEGRPFVVLVQAGARGALAPFPAVRTG
jgi:RNAse (barnase) inhibitor barstar